MLLLRPKVVSRRSQVLDDSAGVQPCDPSMQRTKSRMLSTERWNEGAYSIRVFETRRIQFENSLSIPYRQDKRFQTRRV
ncbi:hypothetical protein ARMGADRAFT_1019956, partial [Armillaria gallica]